MKKIFSFAGLLLLFQHLCYSQKSDREIIDS